MPLLIVESVSFDGSSIALVTGRPATDEGEPQYKDPDIVTTIGADTRMAGPIAEHLQAYIDGNAPDQPVAEYEHWAVLG